MSHWERPGQSNEWYTPKYIFDALGCDFDLDPANAALGGAHVPCRESYGSRGLERSWHGFVWMNPPFEGRNGLAPWLAKFFEHGDGIALTPDRTSAPWWREFAPKAHAILFIAPKVKFEKPDGTAGESPSNGTALLAVGCRGVNALSRAAGQGLGMLVQPIGVAHP